VTVWLAGWVVTDGAVQAAPTVTVGCVPSVSAWTLSKGVPARASPSKADVKTVEDDGQDAGVTDTLTSTK
jgi:hypothetical protein